MAPEYCNNAYKDIKNGYTITCKISGDTCVRYSQENTPPGCILHLKSEPKGKENAEEWGEVTEEDKEVVKERVQEPKTKLLVKMPANNSNVIVKMPAKPRTLDVILDSEA